MGCAQTTSGVAQVASGALDEPCHLGRKSSGEVASQPVKEAPMVFTANGEDVAGNGKMEALAVGQQSVEDVAPTPLVLPTLLRSQSVNSLVGKTPGGGRYLFPTTPISYYTGHSCQDVQLAPESPFAYRGPQELTHMSMYYAALNAGFVF